MFHSQRFLSCFGWTSRTRLRDRQTLRILSVRGRILALGRELTWPYGKNALDVALLCGLLGSRRGVAVALDESFVRRGAQGARAVSLREWTGKDEGTRKTRISVVSMDR